MNINPRFSDNPEALASSAFRLFTIQRSWSRFLFTAREVTGKGRGRSTHFFCLRPEPAFTRFFTTLRRSLTETKDFCFASGLSGQEKGSRITPGE
ncbi:hypothetical protein NIM72_18145 [Pantoea sp. B550]|uniref:hypothetical protein n=1 Tax=Pantoea TaxID=53335 RepID=UPI001378A97C|nr:MULTISPECIES: hypothetical protein [Pantoea]MCP1207424.1 hypothetical protein [Pantoea sp. B550]MCT2416664.1 hypothetical protein [Pantoea sp. XY16]NBB55359.1 hypothetical protein [Pantoea vagans]QZX94646.1 hypothetical protein K6R05_12820 [Pantoea alfalfae]WIL40929.1 hypothetical protein QPJ96_13015 [Pantoea agglomerans]